MKLKLDKKDVENFLKGLIEGYDLYAPAQLTEGVSAFKKIDRPEEVNLTQPVTQKPAKEAFFPQSEVMFRYEEGRTGARSFLRNKPKERGSFWGPGPAILRRSPSLKRSLQGKTIPMSILPKRERGRPSLVWVVIIPSPPASVLQQEGGLSIGPDPISSSPTLATPTLLNCSLKREWLSA